MTSRQEPCGSSADKRTLLALRQIKAFAKNPDLDCGCSSIVGEVLVHLVPRQRAAVVQELFVSAIRQRGKLETLLELLKELDQFGPATDISEIGEAAMIFEDIAQQARLGSQLLKAFVFNREDVRGPPHELRLPETAEAPL
ncbi:hypothetical protein CO662_34470 [Rhizobium anhuiense]|jgi:hypothetical protein|uniref:Uncharacterized protein n=1 Tax=Rhizobium anhuiense TaxID=1184720 RepID=A0ABX4IZK8_9HYPH|nr:hypothetical protein [Rhizobium anhuiense]PDS40578.1 hypothetical protein CO668_33295 [Rhizobium anhuiense]PDS47522.1 hypothetical protein CO662_34470 [Rhizobium anhuiense]